MRKVTGFLSEGVAMREYYTLNGVEYDDLTALLRVMKRGDVAQSRRTTYHDAGDSHHFIADRNYDTAWRTYAVSSISDMRLSLREATAAIVTDLPLAHRYDGDLPQLVFRF